METLESALAELFDVIVGGGSKRRIGFKVFSTIVQSSARTELLTAAIEQGLTPESTIKAEATHLRTLVSAFGQDATK